MVHMAISLLELGKLELILFVKEKLIRNPFLEEDLVLPFPLDAPLECDVVVRYWNRDYNLFVNDKGLPNLRLKPLGSQASKEEIKLYNEAAWIIKGLKKRREILERVSQKLIEVQRSYILGASDSPLPLTIRALAELSGFHESIVSRITRRKRILTLCGEMSMRQLLGSGGRKEAICRAILSIINNEGKEAFSDRVIATRLNSQGLKISRRAVAKYRKLLGIPPYRCR
jgi:RNA polymerase sigma-54 factor